MNPDYVIDGRLPPNSVYNTYNSPQTNPSQESLADLQYLTEDLADIQGTNRIFRRT